MYYVFKSNMKLTKKFTYFKNLPDDFESSHWKTGERFKSPPSLITFIVDEETPGVFSDFLLTTGGLHIYSPKLRSVLNKIGVTNIEYVPVTLHDSKKEIVVGNYCIANIIGNVYCLDVEKSNVSKFSDGIGYQSVEEFSIIPENVLPIEDMSSPPHLFRLGEFKNHVIADEKIKAAFADEGLTGAEFILTTKYC